MFLILVVTRPFSLVLRGSGKAKTCPLFSLYLNDLDDFLTRDPSAGLEFETRDDEMFIYLRLIVLLCADDTVLLANNETDLYINMSRFRTGNHKLPIEIGRWDDTEYAERKYPLCETSVGDELHYVLECAFFKRERQLLIPQQCRSRPNTLKFRNLVNTREGNTLINLAILPSL